VETQRPGKVVARTTETQILRTVKRGKTVVRLLDGVSDYGLATPSMGYKCFTKASTTVTQAMDIHS
jgi:hypothetical protein